MPLPSPGHCRSRHASHSGLTELDRRRGKVERPAKRISLRINGPPPRRARVTGPRPARRNPPAKPSRGSPPELRGGRTEGAPDLERRRREARRHRPRRRARGCSRPAAARRRDPISAPSGWRWGSYTGPQPSSPASTGRPRGRSARPGGPRRGGPRSRTASRPPAPRSRQAGRDGGCAEQARPSPGSRATRWPASAAARGSRERHDPDHGQRQPVARRFVEDVARQQPRPFHGAGVRAEKRRRSVAVAMDEPRSTAPVRPVHRPSR